MEIVSRSIAKDLILANVSKRVMIPSPSWHVSDNYTLHDESGKALATCSKEFSQVDFFEELGRELELLSLLGIFAREYHARRAAASASASSSGGGSGTAGDAGVGGGECGGHGGCS